MEFIGGLGKKVASAISHAQVSPGTVRIVIKHVHFGTYLTVIKHMQERAFFCYSIKSRAHLSTYRYEGDVTS